MRSFFLNYKAPAERAQVARRVELVKAADRTNSEFTALPGCDCWVDELNRNIDGTQHTDGCQVVQVEQPPPRFDIQWTWFPSFIATDLRMHGQLEAALVEKWAGKLTVESLEDPAAADGLHLWICQWVASQYPFYTGLEQWLLDMVGVQPRG